jgi:L-lactate utilization protein LutB
VDLSGSSVIAKKRAMDEVLRKDIDTVIERSKGALEQREKALAENADLIEEVKAIKRAQLKNLSEHVFGSAERIRKCGLGSVFIAKKPVDIAEYVRGVTGDKRIGIVPSPQTIEAEVMQAFYVSNYVELLSERYAGHLKGIPFLHPYFPYPGEKGKIKHADVKYVIISAVAATDSGRVYLEAEEAEVMKHAKEPFVITTVDRIFTDLEAEKVIKLMEMSSGGFIKPVKAELRGHLILFDNNRISLSRSAIKDILMCVNCYSCSLYCPVYLTIGSLFGSPMMAGIGALSAGYQSGVKMAVNRGLYHCTLCRRCDVECPTDVPITDMTLRMRAKAQVSGV